MSLTREIMAINSTLLCKDSWQLRRKLKEMNFQVLFTTTRKETTLDNCLCFMISRDRQVSKLFQK